MERCVILKKAFTTEATEIKWPSYLLFVINQYVSRLERLLSAANSVVNCRFYGYSNCCDRGTDALSPPYQTPYYTKTPSSAILLIVGLYPGMSNILMKVIRPLIIRNRHKGGSYENKEDH